MRAEARKAITIAAAEVFVAVKFRQKKAPAETGKNQFRFKFRSEIELRKPLIS